MRIAYTYRAMPPKSNPSALISAALSIAWTMLTVALVLPFAWVAVAVMCFDGPDQPYACTCFLPAALTVEMFFRVALLAWVCTGASWTLLVVATRWQCENYMD